MTERADSSKMGGRERAILPCTHAVHMLKLHNKTMSKTVV